MALEGCAGGLINFKDYVSNTVTPFQRLPRPFVLMMCLVYNHQQMKMFLHFTSLLAFRSILHYVSGASVFW